MTDHDQEELNRIKRLRTARACDQCRRVRSRCDIANPTVVNSDESICERCRRLNLECTFILPIDETRGKRIPTKANPDHSSPSQDPATTEGSPSTAEACSDPVERFKAFISANLPIISPRDLSHDSSILLHCCARFLVTLCIESSSDGTVGKLKASLDAYMLNKTLFKTPAVQNVQALLLLALLVDDLGYGLKFMTAVRMACSLGWNLQNLHDGSGTGNSDSEDTAYVRYLWWTLVTQDIWLYLYSGLPLLINYRDFNIPCPSNPPLFVSLVSLSEILRFKIRPSSLSDRLPTTTPYTVLQEWQTLHLPASSLYNSLSLATTREREKSLTAEAVIRLCHGAALSVFILDHNRSDPFPQHAEYYLQAALQSNLDFPNVFQKIKLLERLSSICALGLLRLSELYGTEVQEGALTAWGDLVGAGMVKQLFVLAQDVRMGWGVIWQIRE